MSRDVYITIRYEGENGKKATQNLVPRKYKLRFGDAKPSLNHREDILPLHKDTVLLKKPGHYCFLLRCKKDGRTLYGVGCGNSFTRRGSKICLGHCSIMIFKTVNMKTWHCKHKKMCIRISYKNVKTPLCILKRVMFLMQEIQASTTLSSLYGNTQHLPMTIS